MARLKVLLLGSGGREHALAWRISQSALLDRLWVAEGNAGTAHLATNLPINSADTAAVVRAARELGIDLVVVGPELPLANGVVDQLAEAGIDAFGPSQAAAQIEASKSFARSVMQASSVPCPEFASFTTEQSAREYISGHPGPLVVKADGLAAGKGVLLCSDSSEATAAVAQCMSERAFGSAGETVVIEEFLTGPEVSVFAFTDGETVSPLIAACDYKKVGDANIGPNTGGMGSYTPPYFWTPELAAEVKDRVIEPVLREMADTGTPYRGVLYAGLMLTKDGIKTLEFNCRFGDPEAQVILPQLESDPLEVMVACARGNLAQVPVLWGNKPHVGVVMTSGGYPAEYGVGHTISGLDRETPNSLVFQAGTKKDGAERDSSIITSGGRVLTVVGWGENWEEARANSYRRVEQIEFEGAYYRKDIGKLDYIRESLPWPPEPVSQNS